MAVIIVTITTVVMDIGHANVHRKNKLRGKVNAYVGKDDIQENKYGIDGAIFFT